jgi:VIT1/CCC1 family predicted Fe2+/Mn2+ transporter
MSRRSHRERHAIGHIGWLRAAVLGAHDGVLSTASLIVGVAGASAGPRPVLVAGIAGLIAGALSMAAGEYVSVSSQADIENADLAREARELHEDPIGEHRELAGIYRQRGLDPELAAQVATQLTAHDALQAHARDELGLTEIAQARPLQAALASAGAFTVGAIVPLAAVFAAPFAHVAAAVILAAIVVLAGLGATSARVGRAPVLPAVLRTTSFGAAAMVLTLVIGRLIGTAV